MSLWLGAGLSPADRERLVVLLEGGELAGSVTVADRPLRRVLRAPLDLGAVYVKQELLPAPGGAPQ
ncbi:MAG: hypothetical protein R3F30_11845 [Planctomycetota bacterium]